MTCRARFLNNLMIITSLEQITEKWLTAPLNQAVIKFEIQPLAAHNSIAARLNMRYEGNSEQKLFLKLKQNG